MAKVAKRFIEKEIVTVDKVQDGIVLELTADEAEYIFAVIGNTNCKDNPKPIIDFASSTYRLIQEALSSEPYYRGKYSPVFDENTSTFKVKERR